jgi:hypothetical protein
MALSTLAAVCENRIYGTLAREKSGLGSTLGRDNGMCNAENI